MTQPSSRLLPAAASAAFLDPARGLARLPRHPGRARPAEFLARYEALALFYDCFWHADGTRILLVGPPPLNLMPALRGARVVARPSGTPLRPRFFASAAVMLTELSGAPVGTEAVAVRLPDGQEFELPVQPSSAAALAGRRVLFTVSKDNDLAWIREWAHYHARIQGADAVVFFDNGSTRYAPGEVAETLLSVPGIAEAAVLSWPHLYGAPDPAVRINPFYTHFLQIGAMGVALRRYAARAAGLLNCDVDELVATPEGGTVFSRLARSSHGLLVMRGQYVEPLPADGAPEPRTHRHFPFRHRDPARRLSRPRKWALDPTRPWVADLRVHPYMHWIEGRPWFSKTQSPEVFYWHFRGISTNWKDRRADLAGLDRSAFEPDGLWQATAARL